MYATLGALSRLVATPPGVATVETVVSACAEIRRLLDAEDAYVVRSGDPAFLRLGDAGDPADYEIKQRGYWYAWREAAANPSEPTRLLTVADRLVGDIIPLAAGVPATHVAAILPGDESNSEMLIVRGPWAHGLSEEQVELLCSVRPLMAYLIGNVLDSERRERLQGQMRVLGEIAEAFTQAEHADNPLSALATALSRASGFAWVVILVFDPGIERVIDRAINVGRHSNTQTAERGRRGEESENSGERDVLGARHMAWTRQPYAVPDVGDPNEQLLVNDELRPYYEQAHILSMASFPVFAKDALYATITFCGSEQHAFDEAEMGFLGSLVAQAGPTMRAFKLNRELRETDQRLRAVFTNAPVFITSVSNRPDRSPRGGPAPSAYCPTSSAACRALASAAGLGRAPQRARAGSGTSSLRASAIDSEQSRIEAASIAFSSGASSTSNTFSTPRAPSITGTPR